MIRIGTEVTTKQIQAVCHLTFLTKIFLLKAWGTFLNFTLSVIRRVLVVIQKGVFSSWPTEPLSESSGSSLPPIICMVSLKAGSTPIPTQVPNQNRYFQGPCKSFRTNPTAKCPTGWLVSAENERPLDHQLPTALAREEEPCASSVCVQTVCQGKQS